MPTTYTTAAAYQQLKASGALNESRFAIIAAAIKFRKGRGFTRPELLKATGYGENQISGRCRDLIDSGVFIKTGNTILNQRTGKFVEVLELDPEFREAWRTARRARVI